MAAGFIEQNCEAAVTLGVVRVALQALVVQVLGLLQVAGAVVERAGFVERCGQVVVAFGRFRVGVRPVVEQLVRVWLAAGFGEQDGQAAVALGVVRVALQALVVKILSLLQVAWAVVERACFVKRGGQVVVAFGRFRILRDRLLEAIGRLLVVALLIEADTFDVGRLRLDVAAAGGDREAERECGEDAAGGGNTARFGLIDCVGCGSHLARESALGKEGARRVWAGGEKVAEGINGERVPQDGLLEGESGRN